MIKQTTLNKIFKLIGDHTTTFFNMDIRGQFIVNNIVPFLKFITRDTPEDVSFFNSCMELMSMPRMARNKVTIYYIDSHFNRIDSIKIGCMAFVTFIEPTRLSPCIVLDITDDSVVYWIASIGFDEKPKQFFLDSIINEGGSNCIYDVPARWSIEEQNAYEDLWKS